MKAHETAREERKSHLIFVDGLRRHEALTVREQAGIYARAIHLGAEGFVEVVAARRKRDGALAMRTRRNPRNYVRAGDGARLADLCERAAGDGLEVFSTPLARRDKRPGKAAVLGGACVWVDIDEAKDEEGLWFVDLLRPHLWVHSGGGHHLYWRLAEQVPAQEIESLNRRLAHALGGDMACTDRGRIMRMPGTMNHRRKRRARIVRLDLARPPADPAKIGERYPDPCPVARRAPTTRARPSDDIEAVSPPEYFRALVATQVGKAGGYVRCPLPDHDDEVASCRVYPEAREGWHCYGCRRGGTIYDLASLMMRGPSGSALRGKAFQEIRELIEERLG